MVSPPPLCCRGPRKKTMYFTCPLSQTLGKKVFFIWTDFAFFTYGRLLPLLLLTCFLHICWLAAFTRSCLLPSLLLACCLYFSSLAAFAFACPLPWLLLACYLYFCSLVSDNLFYGFVTRLVVERESLYLHLSVLTHNLASHM